MDDDLYPRDGADFTPASYAELPEERREEEREEKAKLAASYPVLEDVADWFSREIEAASDIHNIQVSAMSVNGVKYSRTIHVEAQVLAYQLLKEKLQSKYMQFIQFQEGLK